MREIFDALRGQFRSAKAASKPASSNARSRSPRRSCGSSATMRRRSGVSNGFSLLAMREFYTSDNVLLSEVTVLPYFSHMRIIAVTVLA